MRVRGQLPLALLLVAGCGEIDIGTNNTEEQDDFWEDDCMDGCAPDDDDDFEEPECTSNLHCGKGNACVNEVCEVIELGTVGDCGEVQFEQLTLAQGIAAPTDVLVGDFEDGSVGQDLMLLYGEEGSIERVDAETRVSFEAAELAGAQLLVGLQDMGSTPRVLALGSQLHTFDADAEEGSPAMVGGSIEDAIPSVGFYGGYGEDETLLALPVAEGVAFYGLSNDAIGTRTLREVGGQLVGAIAYEPDVRSLVYLEEGELTEVWSGGTGQMGSAFPLGVEPTLVDATAIGTRTTLLAGDEDALYLSRVIDGLAPQVFDLGAAYSGIARVDDSSYLLVSAEGPSRVISFADPANVCIATVTGTEALAGLEPIEVDLYGDSVNEVAFLVEGDLIALSRE